MRNLKQRRRAGSVAGVIAAVVALAVPAFASGAAYSGTLKGGGTLSFKTATKNGRIASVKSFSLKGVPTRCDQGAYRYSTVLPFSIAVKNKAFAITATGGGVAQHVAGLFTHRGRKASGTLNIYGGLAPGHTNCYTGQRQWSATRG